MSKRKSQRILIERGKHLRPDVYGYVDESIKYLNSLKEQGITYTEPSEDYKYVHLFSLETDEEFATRTLKK